jgi:hypothetical protein
MRNDPFVSLAAGPGRPSGPGRLSRTALAALAFLAALAPLSPWSRALPLRAQTPPPAADPGGAKRAAIDKVSFLAGEWEGGGYFEYSPGKQERFQGVERVEPRLGGQILLFEGRHLAAEGARKGEVVHEAFAVLSWDDKAKTYRFRTYTSEGRGGEFDGKAEDGAFVWAIQSPERQTRYTLKLDPQGRWFETGESSADGKTWRKFFEMTLTKKGGSPKP